MFVLVLIAISLIVRKVKAASEFSQNKEKINNLLFMVDLMLHNQSERGLDSVVQIVCVFSEDVGIDFGGEKFAMLVMMKGKIVNSVVLEFPDGKVIKLIQEGES